MKKRKWQAIKADVGEYEGIRHEGKEYRFGWNDTFTMSDEGLVRELDSIHGKKGTQKIAFAEYNDHTTQEPGHTYTFGALTSKQARENYDRIFRRKRR